MIRRTFLKALAAIGLAPKQLVNHAQQDMPIPSHIDEWPTGDDKVMYDYWSPILLNYHSESASWSQMTKPGKMKWNND